MTESTIPKIRALCCECGTFRTWSTKAGLRRHAWRAYSPQEIADYEVRCGREWRGDKAYHRQLADMKCDTCKGVRRHALVGGGDDDPKATYRDEIENPPVEKIVEIGRAEFEVEMSRLQRFGIQFEYRDDTAFMVGGGVHFYDIEQYDDDHHFMVRLNPNLPWPLLSRALDCAWKTIADRGLCERRDWSRRRDHRSLYYTVDDKLLDDYMAREVLDASRWRRMWALREGVE